VAYALIPQNVFYSVDSQKTDFFLSSTHQPPEAIEGRAITVPRKSGRAQKMWKPHLYTCNAFLHIFLVNMYIIYKEMLKRRGTAREAMNVWSSTLQWQRHKPQIGLGQPSVNVPT